METAVPKALNLKRIAVVGASKNPVKAAHYVPRYLQRNGYKIFPVNPSGDKVLLGEKVYRQLGEIPDQIDLVLVFRPSSQVLPIVEEALKRGDLRGIWLQEGIKSKEASQLCAQAGILFVEDKCMLKEHRRS